jgi:hypothetical protein
MTENRSFWDSFLEAAAFELLKVAVIITLLMALFAAIIIGGGY